MFQEFKTYKNNLMFSAFLMTTFIFPFIGNISTADALGNYGCYAEYKNTHVSCLRSLLDTTQYGGTVPKSDGGLGNYGCYDKDKNTHVNCLRSLLDKHGPHLAQGANTPDQIPLGTHPTCPSGTNCDPTQINPNNQDELSALHARIAQLEGQLSVEQEGVAREVDRLRASVAQLQGDLSSSNAAQEPLNTRIGELEKQLSDAREVHRISVERYEQSDRALRADLAAANAAQESLNQRIANLERQLSGVSVGNTPQEPINPGSVDSENQITTGTPLSGGEIENNAPLRGDENDTNAAHELWAQEHGGRTISAGYEEVGIELHFIREPTRSQPNRLKLYVSLEYPNSNMEHCLSYGTGDCHLIEIIAGVHQRIIDHVRGSIDRRREEVASCEARGPGYKVVLRDELYGRGNYVLQVPFDTGPGQQGTYNVKEVVSCNR